MTPTPRRLLLLVTAGLAVLGPRPASAQAPVAEVRVTPPSLALATGARQPVSALAFDKDGNVLLDVKVTFASSDTAVATVAPDGTVTATGPGAARIEAIAGSRRGAITVTVTGPSAATRPVSLALEPQPLVLIPGERQPLRLVARRADGGEAETGPVTWRTLHPALVRVDAAGTVEALAAGTGVVQALAAGLIATATVKVVPADVGVTRTELRLGVGDVDSIRAIVPAQGDRPLGGGFAWTSSDTAVATVTPQGIVAGRAPGTAAAVMVGPDVALRIPITVYSAVAGLEVSPPFSKGPLRLAVQGTRTLSAQAVDTAGRPVAGATVAWTVGDTALVAFDRARGALTGLAAGRTTVTAKVPGVAPATWEIEVVPADVAIRPARLGLAPDGAAQLSARLLDPDGKELGPLEGARWVTSEPRVARVRPDGSVEAGTRGRATITATAPWGRSAEVPVFVTGDLFVASTRGGRPAIYDLTVANPDSLRLVLDDGATAVQPALSPDGTRLAWTSNQGGNYDVWVADADGTNRRRLTDDPAFDGEPQWLPDGSALVFSSTRGGTSRLWVVGADGTGLRPLTAPTASATSPSVSPDGARVAFVRSDASGADLYDIRIDGADERRLTTTPERERLPRWLPGGRLAWVVDRGTSSSAILAGPAGGVAPVTLATSDRPVTGFAVSRDGSRLAWVSARSDAERGAGGFALVIQAATPGAAPATVRLRPGEQVQSPAFR